jgi:hypothetical protein
MVDNTFSFRYNVCVALNYKSKKGENQMEKTKYFETIEQAQEFVKKNKIKDYCFYTPEFLESGVELCVKDGFFCEICKEYTPFECEGCEPNTCAMCMPIYLG